MEPTATPVTVEIEPSPTALRAEPPPLPPAIREAIEDKCQREKTDERNTLHRVRRAHQHALKMHAAIEGSMVRMRSQGITTVIQCASAGAALESLKQDIPHGQWYPYLEQIGLPKRTATHYMDLGRKLAALLCEPTRLPELPEDIDKEQQKEIQRWHEKRQKARELVSSALIELASEPVPMLELLAWGQSLHRLTSDPKLCEATAILIDGRTQTKLLRDHAITPPKEPKLPRGQYAKTVAKAENPFTPTDRAKAMIELVIKAKNREGLDAVLKFCRELSGWEISWDNTTATRKL